MRRHVKFFPAATWMENTCTCMNCLNTELFILENLECAYSTSWMTTKWTHKDHFTRYDLSGISLSSLCMWFTVHACEWCFYEASQPCPWQRGSNWLENVWNVNLTRGINYYFQKECLESLLNEDISIWRHSDKCILVLKQYIYAKIKSIGI